MQGFGKCSILDIRRVTVLLILEVYEFVVVRFGFVVYANSQRIVFLSCRNFVCNNYFSSFLLCQ